MGSRRGRKLKDRRPQQVVVSPGENGRSVFFHVRNEKGQVLCDMEMGQGSSVIIAGMLFDCFFHGCEMEGCANGPEYLEMLDAPLGAFLESIREAHGKLAPGGEMSWGYFAHDGPPERPPKDWS